MISTQDRQVVLHLLRGQPRAGSHAERLENFYAPQAGYYDHFRERLLHGRRELIAALQPAPGQWLVELGGGTGRNLDFLGARLDTLARFDLVDLCPSLLAQARLRAAQWPGIVRVHEADATRFRPDADGRQVADCVYFSYSLSMIPDWRRALRNALRMLKPGGLIGVVDFYVSAKEPPPGRQRHGWLQRQFWPRWFRHDGVSLDGGQFDEVTRLTENVRCEEHLAAIPYLPGLGVPYYLYIGRKKSH